MSKIIFHTSKTLKLQNVLQYKVPRDDSDFHPEIVMMQMDAYIKSKGLVQIGPLIQRTSSSLADDRLHVDISLMLQCNKMIHKVEAPYRMDPIIRVNDALYVRYIGPQEKLQLAYSKIQLEAFETDIDIGIDSYTIFVDADPAGDSIMADVFVPKKNS